MAENKRWLKDFEVEQRSGGVFNASTLRKDRTGLQRYPFHLVGRNVFYDLQELDAMVESSRRGGTADVRSKANAE